MSDVVYKGHSVDDILIMSHSDADQLIKDASDEINQWDILWQSSNPKWRWDMAGTPSCIAMWQVKWWLHHASINYNKTWLS